MSGCTIRWALKIRISFWPVKSYAHTVCVFCRHIGLLYFWNGAEMSIDPSNPEILISVLTDAEAVAIILALKEYGIEATTTGGFTAGFRAESPGGINVIVKHTDLNRARNALDEIQAGLSGIDWSEIDVGEPDEK